jgi:hypothetical protein
VTPGWATADAVRPSPKLVNRVAGLMKMAGGFVSLGGFWANRRRLNQMATPRPTAMSSTAIAATITPTGAVEPPPLLADAGVMGSAVGAGVGGVIGGVDGCNGVGGKVGAVDGCVVVG